MPLLTTSVNGFWKRVDPSQSEALCFSLLNQARRPYFYENWGVSDTLEGRFDCAILHLCLLLRHLNAPLGQVVFDSFFSYTDLTLREMGVSDLKVGKQVKKCAKFFYGALKAYEDALEGRASLREALIRNLYGNTNYSCANEVAAYVKMCDQLLRTEDIATGKVKTIPWPPLPPSPKMIDKFLRGHPLP
jgi:cytochrome b pre-mRNA-processing protein 3